MSGAWESAVGRQAVHGPAGAFGQRRVKKKIIAALKSRARRRGDMFIQRRAGLSQSCAHVHNSSRKIN